MLTPAPDHTHLGDGAYASHDSFGIWLAANHHENRVIYLEPEVFMALVAYAKRIGLNHE